MRDIIDLIDRLREKGGGRTQKSPLKDLGFISITHTVHIRHVPFPDPCLILVLSGRKTVFDGPRKVVCDTGAMLAVPGPASYDLRNEPDARTGRYCALIIPFKLELLERLSRSHNLLHDVSHETVEVLSFVPDDTLYASVRHYLTTTGGAKLLQHRLMEILLLLVTQRPIRLSFALRRDSWAQRVRAVISGELTRAWDIAEVGKRLATTESTLRRRLREEGTGFRELLQELRLGAALMQLLQTELPIYRIAYDCGYQSVSRFTANFHRRFGLTPKAVRVSLSESEQKLEATGKSGDA